MKREGLTCERKDIEVRITKISVKGLFGMFDHEIPLNQESRITIVHGPNGVGKSVMLHMLHGFFQNELEIFRSTPFVQFRIDYQDGATISIDKQGSGATLTVQFVDGSGHETKSFEVGQPEDKKQLANTNRPAWYIAGYTGSLQTEFIDTFRLISSRYETYRSASDIGFVSAVISDIEEEIRSVFSDLEGLEDFFQLLEVMVTGKYSGRPRPYDSPFESFDEWLRKREDRIEQVREYFLRGSDREEHDRECNFFAVMDFFRMVNSRILYKGMDFVDGHILFYNQNLSLEFDGLLNDIPLSALSSGEQHLLTLYYRLLFETDEATLVIIDEPEISMNVVWQRNFLKDLQRIIELRKFDVLIATHSPEVIFDKWDWAVALSAKADG